MRLRRFGCLLVGVIGHTLCARAGQRRWRNLVLGRAMRRAIAPDFSSGQRRRRPLLPLKDQHLIVVVAGCCFTKISLSRSHAHFESRNLGFRHFFHILQGLPLGLDGVLGTLNPLRPTAPTSTPPSPRPSADTQNIPASSSTQQQQHFQRQQQQRQITTGHVRFETPPAM